MRINKAIIISLMIPLVSGIYTVPAGAIGMATLSRPSATSRLPTARPNTMQMAPVINTKPSADAGLVATCANPLPERLTAARCINRYESCLRQDNVCGEHFELCYNVPQFKKSRIMCQERLAQCPAEAIKALFGNSVTTSDDMAAANRTMCDGESVLTKRTFTPALGELDITADSRIGIAIKDGKIWAAANSVKTCNKVADACIQNACKNSPHKCIAAPNVTSEDIDYAVNASISQDLLSKKPDAPKKDKPLISWQTSLRLSPSMIEIWVNNMAWQASDVRKYIEEQCRDTIGGNEWCFTVANGNPPREVDLEDADEIKDVYDDIMYTGVGPRWKMAQSKIKEWAAAAVQNSAEQCRDTLAECVLNACGEGSRARCYGLAKDETRGGTVSIKNKAAIDITGQCKDLIENNQYCKDVFLSNNTGVYGDVWKAVWDNDLTGAIVGLDTDLQKAFNEQAVAGMRTSCQAQVEKCVEEECGNDFSRCFITSSLKNLDKEYEFSIDNGFVTKSGSFVGGFDAVLARDLCMLKVKKFTDCIDYFDVETARNTSGKSADSWKKTNNVRNAWLTASDISQNDVEAKAAQERSNQEIFYGLLADIGKRANSVLEREANDIKNACENSNIKGSTNKDYIWASLSDIETAETTKANEVLEDFFNADPSNVEYTGFRSVTETNNPFDGFCAVKVTMRSNNAKVNKLLGKNKVRYYPKGTAMQCLGLTTEELEKIEREIADDIKVCGKDETPSTHNCSERLTGLQKTLRIGGATLGSLVIGGLGGAMAGNAIERAVNKDDSSSKYEKKLKEIKIAYCDQCIDNQGKGYDENCEPNKSSETNNTIAFKCSLKKAELETTKSKNSLLDFSTKSGGWSAIGTGVVSAVAGGMIAGNAINQKEAQALEEARQKAIEDFNKQTDINCYIGGRKVASYGQEMVIK